MRAIFVTEDDGRLLGVVTRKTLVREVVAAGLEPAAVSLREIAEPPNFTLDAGLELEGAFRFLEEQDLERVPVVEEGGRLVGVLSRAVVQRRLAEDEPPEGEPEARLARALKYRRERGTVGENGRSMRKHFASHWRAWLTIAVVGGRRQRAARSELLRSSGAPNGDFMVTMRCC